VGASAGSGKTCCVSQYIDHEALPCFWFDLEADVTDPASFFRAVARAAGTAALPAYLPERRENVEAFAARFFEQLCGSLKPRTQLVFDNLEGLQAQADVIAAIGRTLERFPQTMRLVLISRNAPPPTLARATAMGLLDVLCDADLRFTKAETLDLAASGCVGETVAETEASAIHEAVEGWTAGVVLSFRTRTRPEHGAHKPFGGARGLMHAYFAEEVLSKLSERECELLSAIAWLPEVNVSQARALTGQEKATDTLRALAAGNHFTALLDGGTETYRLHPSFAAFLRQQGALRSGPEATRQLQVKAGKLLAKGNNTEAAARLFQKANAWGELADLVENHAADMLEHGQNDLVHQWCRSAREHAPDDRAGLWFWQARARMHFDAAEAAELFSEAYRRYLEVEDVPQIYLCWAGAVEGLLYGAGFVSLDPWLDALPGLLERFPPNTMALKARVAAITHSALVCRRPADPAIPHWERRVRRFMRMSKTISPAHYALMASNMLHHDLWCGRIASARVQCEAVERVVRSRRLDGSIVTGFQLIKCHLALVTGDAFGTVDAAKQGLQTAERTGAHHWDSVLLGMAGLGALMAEQNDCAKRYRDAMRERLRPDNAVELLTYHDLAARVAVAEGELADALHHRRSSLEAALSSGHPYCMAVESIGAADIEFANGNASAARNHLACALAIAREMGSRILEARVFASRALMAFTESAPEEGRAHLATAFAVCREEGYSCLDSWNPRMMRELCWQAYLHGIEKDVARRFIETWRFEPREPHFADWPWAVRIFTLQAEFRVEVSGSTLAARGKSQRRPLELLKALIAFGGVQVSEARLADALWPDAEGDASQRALTTTLHRLRKLVGNDAVLRQSAHLSINPRHCWVDCLQLRELGREADMDTLLGEWRRYQKPFLWQVDTAWALPFREALAAHHEREVLALSRQLMRAQRIAAAESLLLATLGVNPGSIALSGELKRLDRSDEGATSGSEAGAAGGIAAAAKV
jgi:hypothetical protein